MPVPDPSLLKKLKDAGYTFKPNKFNEFPNAETIIITDGRSTERSRELNNKLYGKFHNVIYKEKQK